AVFDVKKLDWMNSEYIKKLPLDQLYERADKGGFFDKPLIQDAPEAMRTETYLRKVLAVEQERLATLSGIGEENPFFFVDALEYAADRLVWKKSDRQGALTELKRAAALAENLDEGEWEDLSRLEAVFLEAS